MSEKASGAPKLVRALSGVAGRFYAGMIAGILALIALSIYGSVTISTVLTERKQAELKSLTEVAISTVADLEARARKGEISTEEAKKRALDALRSMRYNGSDYYIAFDYKHVILAHPNPAMIGKDQTDAKDSTGNLFTQQQVQVARSGGGFVRYLWPKPNETQPSLKMTYSSVFPQWEWVIATGVYIDQLDAMNADYRNTLLQMVAVAAMIMLLIAFGLGRSISKPIQKLVANMRALAGGDLGVTIEGTSRRDEIGVMAGSVQVFKDAMIAKKQADEAAALEVDAKTRRAEVLDQLTKRFELNVSALTQGLSSAATEMEATAQSMTSIAGQTTQQSVTVSSAAQQTSANVQTVAAATEELSISIREIASQ
ncbi:MAG: cache domain-containing protein, partial [Microvirga sp.]